MATKKEEHVLELLEVYSGHSRNWQRIRTVMWVALNRVEIDDEELSELKAKVVFLEELVRLGTVFLHSLLEDALREIMRISFKYKTDISIPNHIKFTGSNSAKITIDELSRRHRDKAVEEVIEESLVDYLDNITFSSTDSITAHLQAVNIHLPQAIRNEVFPSIQELCRRRHQIVHQADQITVEGERALAELPLKPKDKMIVWGISVGKLLAKATLLAMPEIPEASRRQEIAKAVNMLWQPTLIPKDEEE